MTEMEQLKKNTEEQLAKERFTSIFEWMSTVEEAWDVEMVVAKKNLNITMAVVIVQVILSFVFSSPLWLACFILFLILTHRQSKINERIEFHKGRLLGAHKMLFLLGMANSDIEDELTKRRGRKRVVLNSPFKRFKEFFERMGTKNKQEAHV